MTDCKFIFIAWLACVVVQHVQADVPGMVNPGTPAQVPPGYDCTVRKSAWEFGKATLPSRGDFKSLYDALQLQWCNVTAPSTEDTWSPPKYPTPSGKQFIVNASATGAVEDGSFDAPYKTIASAVAASAGQGPATILVAGGVYHEDQMVITPAHNGITIQNYQGEHAVISGGVPITVASPWKKYTPPQPPSPPSPPGLQEFDNMNNVYGRAHSHNNSGTIMYLGTFEQYDDCVANATKYGPFHSITYHTQKFGGPFQGQCFGDTSTFWAPKSENNIISAKNNSYVPPEPKENIWMLDVSHMNMAQILGVRLNNVRAIRAKYPNGNPELSGPDAVNVLTYTDGWITSGTTWVKPADKWNETMDVISNASDWPGVNWPMTQEGGAGQQGEGDWGSYHTGMGGFCDDISPPFGYWCSQNPPRGNCYDPVKRSSRGCTQTHMSPDGVVYTDQQLPNAKNYANPKGAVIQAWRGMARWFTNLCLVDSQDKSSNTLLFDDKIGCNQGGEGNVDFSQWWIENVMEELDAPNEWFYNESTKILYYNFNGTNPTGTENMVATKTKVLFNITGSMTNPVKDFAIKGFEIRDTAYTYLGTDPADIHGMPSGGDWALQRSGAILMEGTERTTVDGNLLTRVDGNGVFVSNYNRNVTVSNNEMQWIGDSAIAGWGSTGKCLDSECKRSIPYLTGPDARGGNQPRGTHVVGNLIREIGLWQKQSSFWFQATCAQSHIERNVHFNGPRAGLNFNDQMGGGDVIEGNLLANCVRESGDHGPWNSWDRIPYITDIGMIRNMSKPAVGDGLPGHDDATGKPSVVPKFREIRHNFIIGTYNSQEDIDTDDGSSYYQTHDNYFAMADHGLKSDFGGQWNHHFRNVYGYVGNCFGNGNNLAFYNNTCASSGDLRCPANPTMSVFGNTLYNDGGKGNNCNGSAPMPFPPDQTLDAMGVAALKPFPMPAPGQEVFQHNTN
eukprot:m.16129 g.16129  ORF g.16129 m.16129 type:complete len:957 (+) comp5588_c0_seq1:70-2940(+)